MDTKYTDASWCPEWKSIVALRLLIDDRWHLFNFPVSFEAILLGSENQEERSVYISMVYTWSVLCSSLFLSHSSLLIPDIFKGEVIPFYRRMKMV